MKKIIMMFGVLGLSYSLVLAGEIQRVCTTSSNPVNYNGKCRPSPYGDGDICYFDTGTGTACNGTLVAGGEDPPSVGG